MCQFPMPDCFGAWKIYPSYDFLISLEPVVYEITWIYSVSTAKLSAISSPEFAF